MEPKVGFGFGAADIDEGVMAGASLSARVATVLLNKIQGENLPAGARLPTENAMAQHFGVSRTVIREAIMTLKAEGVVETHQGRGAFVRRPVNDGSFLMDPLTTKSISNLLGLIEVRRGIESEVASLAALRRDAAQVEDIRRAKARIDEAVAAGGDGVDEDVGFHLAIARATGNHYWVKLVEMFTHQIRSAIAVTRANEARRADFALEVKAEHDRIVDAIVGRDPAAARAAATDHMQRAAERVAAADHEFWTREGGEYARRLAEKS